MTRLRQLTWSVRQRSLAVVSLIALACSDPTAIGSLDVPLTGQAVPGMAALDRFTANLMQQYEIPGGAVAVVRSGKLIYARGFGYADLESRTPVQPDALFRIASLSKPITSAAILKLAEGGALTLDDPVLPYLADLEPAPNATVDARWSQVRIRHLLQHTGGWDRNLSFDPMLRSQAAAVAVGAAAPASTETVIRYMKGVPFDFAPGARYAYSNFGYAVLGYIIERVTGESYESYVKRTVLAPAGIDRTRLGRTRLSEQAPGEVRYYAAGHSLNYPMVNSVFSGTGRVPEAYGGFYIEAMAAHGGWISSTIDLLRFVTSVDGRSNRPDQLAPASVAAMVAPGPIICPGDCWYGLGWVVRPQSGDQNWWHNGTLPGTTSIIVRTWHDFSWVALFNARTDDNAFLNALDPGLWQALAQSTAFPDHDLFTTFP